MNHPKMSFLAMASRRIAETHYRKLDRLMTLVHQWEPVKYSDVFTPSVAKLLPANWALLFSILYSLHKHFDFPHSHEPADSGAGTRAVISVN